MSDTPHRDSGPKHPERIHERSADPQEGADRPLERKESEDVHWSQERPKDPHHALTNPVGEPDPDAEADPYEPEREGDEDPSDA